MMQLFCENCYRLSAILAKNITQMFAWFLNTPLKKIEIFEMKPGTMRIVSCLFLNFYHSLFFRSLKIVWSKENIKQ